MATVPDIWFCFPYRGVGGVPTMFLHAALVLSEHRPGRVGVIDYPDGTLAGHARQHGFSVLPYSDTGALSVPPHSTVVFQSLVPWSTYPGLALSPTTRTFYWTTHLANLTPQLPLLRHSILRGGMAGHLCSMSVLKHQGERTRRFVRLAEAHEGIAYTDHLTARDVYRGLRMRLPGRPVLLPNFLPLAPPAEPRTAIGGSLRCVWVGRVESFKTSILIHLAQRLSRLAGTHSHKLSLTIVGGGDGLVALRQAVENHGSLTIEELGPQSRSALDHILLEKTDLLFAMGTSALEGARLGIPTVCLDFAYANISVPYRFRLFQCKDGMSLGHLIDQRTMNEVPGEADSLAAILSQVLNDPQRIGAAGRSAFARWHSADRVGPLLQKALDRNRLTWGHVVRSHCHRDPLYNLLGLIRGLAKRCTP